MSDNVAPAMSTTSNQACPTCGTMLPVDPAYVTWCAQCNWNLHPVMPPRPQTIVESFYLSLGTRLSTQLFLALQNEQMRTPQFTITTLLAIGLAIGVHLMTILFAALGIVILNAAFPNPVPTIFGIVFLLLAWNLRPQLGRMPADIAPPERFPTLYAVVNRIATTLGAPPVTALRIDESFNASYTRLGWRREQVITIGLPLFAILTPQEQVAILAHEVAHGVNGDHNRALIVGAAINALGRWYRILRPDQSWGQSPFQTTVGFLTMIASAVANVFLRALAWIPWTWSYLLSHLLWRDSQRAEYLADALAARASGTDAMLSALEKLHYQGVVDQAIHVLALRSTSETLLPVLRTQVAALPHHELERIRRSETIELARLDVTHPPTAYRIELLRSHLVTQPQVTLTDAEISQLEQEFARVQTQIQRDLVDSHRRRLYY